MPYNEKAIDLKNMPNTYEREITQEPSTGRWGFYAGSTFIEIDVNVTLFVWLDLNRFFPGA